MLEIRLLGEMEVARGGERMALPPSRKTRALLAYLALAGRPLRRERLCTLFWDAPDNPKGALRWSLSKLRSLVDEPDRTRIVATRETVSFEPAGARIDVAAVKAKLAPGVDAVDIRELEELEAEFRGEFLESLDLPDSHDFEAWRIALREEARALRRRVLGALVERLRGTPGAAIPHARNAVRLDPAEVSRHVALLRLLAAAGQRDAAEEQYAAAQRQLEAEGVPCAPLVFAWRELRKQATGTPPPVSLEPDRDPQAPAEPPPPPTAWEEGERKFATVLVAAAHRIDAEAAAAGLDPEEASSQGDALAAAARVAQRFGGVVSSSSDGVAVALFGAPLTLEDHAVQACRAALALRSALLEESRGALDLRASLDAGEVLVRPGPAGPEAVGQAVRTASRMVHPLPPGTVAATAEVRDRTRGYFRFKTLDVVQPAGPGAPVAMQALLGATAARTRWDMLEARGLEAFLGRAAELAALDEARRKAAGGRGQVVAVVGEAGVGKSRLVHRFARTLLDAGWTLQSTATAPHETGALLPVRGLLRGWLGIAEGDPPAVSARRLRDAAEGLGVGGPTVVPPLSWLLGLPVEDADWSRLAPPQRRRLTIDAFLALATAQARRGPLALVFEDLHWADEESLALLDGLVRVVPTAPILLVVTYRPEYRDDWPGRSSYTLRRLDPLVPEQARALLDGLLGPDPGLDGLKGRVVRQAEGNPLFLEEMARALVDAGKLAGRRGDYRAAAGPAGDPALPATVQDVIAARIDRLPPREKRLLQTAAVLGRVVPYDLLRAISAPGEGDARDALAALEAGEFLYQTRFLPKAEHTFKHALTRQVAYGTLTRARRAGLHAAAAAEIERAWAGDLGAVEEALADHWEAAERWEKAAPYLLRAARRAKAQYGLGQAVALGERARAAASRIGASGGPLAIEALTLLGDLLGLKGDLSGANAHYEAAMALEGDQRRRTSIGNRRHASRSVHRAGGRIAYYEHGAGPLTLAFVHPFLYGLAVFQPLIEELCQEFRIVTIDPRGTGASDPIPPDYGMHDHMDDVRAVLRAAAAGRPVVAVGISRGALVLVRLAALHPELLDRMVLVGGFTRQTVGIGARSVEGAEEPMRELTRAVEAGDLRRAAEIFAPTIFSEPGTEELRGQFVEHCCALPAATVTRFWTLDPENDVSDVLGRVSVPTLVAHGGEDRDTPIALAREMADRMPGASFYAFRGKGHLPTFTATGEFCAVLRRFVRAEDLSGRGRRHGASGPARFIGPMEPAVG